nr:probable transcriptional regulatory protein TDE_1487 isoform X2 [Procambarus clarkii]
MAYVMQALKLSVGPARCAGMESIMSRNLNHLLRNTNITCIVKPSRSMAGHSKWANIKHIKAIKDAEKTKLFTKFAQDMKVAVKGFGFLRLSTGLFGPASLRSITIPTTFKSQDNAKSAIVEYKGPGGVFLVVELLTDNVNRTKIAIQSSIKKLNIQEAKGSANRIFEEKGVVVVNSAGRSVEAAMDSAIEVGAEDVAEEDDSLVFTCSPQDFIKVKPGLENLGYEVIYAGVDYLPKVYVSISDDDEKQLGIILQRLEAINEVMKVHDNLS